MCDVNHQLGPHGKCSFSFCLIVNKRNCCVGKGTEINVLMYLSFSLVRIHFSHVPQKPLVGQDLLIIEA